MITFIILYIVTIVISVLWGKYWNKRSAYNNFTPPLLFCFIPMVNFVIPIVFVLFFIHSNLSKLGRFNNIITDLNNWYNNY